MGNVSFVGGNELVQGGIEEANGHRTALEGDIHGFKVALLHRLELGQRLLALLNGVGADHLADGRDTVGQEEHVLSTAEANALGAELHGLLGIVRVIGVGANTQTAILVGPCHDAAELAADGGVDRGDDAVVDVTGGTVERDEVALVIGLAGELELLVLLVHLDLAAAGNAALTHAARDNSRVGGHTAADGQDALSGLHALDVLRGGLETDENDLLAALLPLLGVLGREDDLAAGSAGGGGQRLADSGSRLERGSVELGMEQGVEVAGLDHGDRLLLVDHTLVDEVAGDLESSLRGTLTAAALEHVELAVLDGELHILHVAVVILEQVADLDEVSVGLGELRLHLGDGHRGADAGDDVLALGVGQELAHELLFAGGGVTGEGNAGTGILIQVAEDHRHDVDGSTPGIGNIIVAAIDVRARVVPGAEHGANGLVQLGLGVGGEVLADLLLILGLELLGELLEVGRGQLNVELDAALFLHRVDELLKVLLAHFHNDIGEHLDEAAIRVVNEALEVGIGVACDHSGNDLVVQTEVQDGVHHAGHGSACAGTDGDEQGVLQIAELLAVNFFHLADEFHDLRHDLVVDLAAVLIVLSAGLGGDGETLGNGQTDVGHLSKVRALAAQKLTHARVTFREQIDILFAHRFSSI